MNLKLIITLTALLAAPACFADWQSVGEGKTIGISGIAPIDKTRYLVVHDNKKPDQPRLSIITVGSKTASLASIAWCDKAKPPIDLEGLTAIPNHSGEYLVLESKGSVTRIKLSGKTCKVTHAAFNLPTQTEASNMEALALQCFGKNCLLAWAERGKNQQPAQLSFGVFDVKNNTLSAPANPPYPFHAPAPTADEARSISDMAIGQDGGLWVSAASDQGDDGPFQSAVYKIGQFQKDKGKGEWLYPFSNPEEHSKYDKVKIEALNFTADGQLILGTDDENQGAKVGVYPK
ncbi:esterase-like activity of phytase family protein [Methylovulum psychrotolerans]|jgi:hypothetical protein|uniref:Phytase-like domain-containing protein n=1 Tax=Methylovulum psychrotolerans TaxID=1704499 RepID=A0A2S5CG32_9GAMM|nr:esterase-like activity of phytase family protein [Methylovulum psychrotolerans]POZ49765.1 hypothetical protein AADEFJLK_04441 [Methylovulum psychrotolerans]